ncbi:hypothetical protein PCS_03523 [Desulfocurvibacter africanus PCS]|uniref:Phosphatidylglycerol lysyltransferase C-terminal domain-containing protein n=1 Tax=Desulfocurvibacter africanus PCS TaxID=1262666 RepID=M5PZA7_DESAF|nr:phosphatidylglycerol lysyltransferase domain-containing protein [Desulfocurvibacter africanus]EMG35696.1 hypothetical protein PCS_03523 [Desulfocurvibacter africanus PCS]
MELSFEPIRIARREEYRSLLARCPQPASDYSFINLWGWQEVYGLEWAFQDGLVWIRQTLPEPVLWAPIGNWAAADWKSMAHLVAGRRFIRVPEKLAERWLNLFSPHIKESRGHWDYVYLVKDLVDLEGERFRKKREQFETFVTGHASEYYEMGPDCVEEALDMQAEWCRWRDCEESGALMAENTAIVHVLENWDRLPELLGGAIRVDGKLVAYTVAEQLSEDTLVIHFEKAHANFEGAYQAINRLFLAHTASFYRYVNREQDLDEPGLRKAKLSYNPISFVHKFELTFT